MPDFNRVILMGNLTRDPELRQLQGGMSVCNVGIAVNERWKDKQTGETQERVNFIDCQAFGRTAEVIDQYMSKGKPIHIEGKLRHDLWQDKDGNSRSKLKVVIDNVQFLGGRDDAQGQAQQRQRPAQQNTPAPTYEPIGESGIPF